MVMLGIHNALPGRYWGEGQGPEASPSQRSILLARINNRARERKAGRQNVQQGKDVEIEKRTTPKEVFQPISLDTETRSEEKPRVNGVKAMEGYDEKVDEEKLNEKKDLQQSEGVLPQDSVIDSTQDLLLPQVVKEDEAPVIKKKKKKREREEESQQEEEISQPKVSAVKDSDIVKKKKKRHKENEDEENVNIESKQEESSLIKPKKKKKHESEEINGERTTDSSETSGNQRKKKRRDGEEERDKTTVDQEIEQSHTLNISQKDVDTSSPVKKKKKKDKNVQLKEEESLQEAKSSEILSLSKVPEIRIKEEVLYAMEEEVEAENREEKHVERNTEELKREIEDKSVNAEKDTKRDMKKKKKKQKQKKKQKEKKKNKEKRSEVAGFTLLTEVEATKKKKVQRTLPHWLANPTVIGRDLTTDGAPLSSLPCLNGSLTYRLEKNNIQQLFPVQRAVIPEILSSAGPLACRYRPRDVCVSAPTGSGKTLAYVLPILHVLKGRTVPRIRALVLLPVQELATQVYHVFLKYSQGSGLHVGRAVGQSSLKKEQATLVATDHGTHHSLVDIIVATPGRLADHLSSTPGFDLSDLRYLVLDEADRMLAAEGGDWVSQVQRAIADHQAKHNDQGLLQPPLQRLLFSATLSNDPEQLQHVTLYHPKLFTVAPPAAGQDRSVAVVMKSQFVRPAELKEEFVVVEEQVKPLALHHLLTKGEGRKGVLVFTNSVHATHKLALLLAALCEGSGRVVAEFSSKRNKRQQILSQFADGKIDVLVSSDAMARGLDIANIDHVVSYDVTAATTYIHRIGRTARAGRPGMALSLVTKATLAEFKKALSGVGEASRLEFNTEELEPYEQQYIDALATLKRILDEEERQRRLNHPDNATKRTKKNKKQRQRKQKKEMMTQRRKMKMTVNANRLNRH